LNNTQGRERTPQIGDVYMMKFDGVGSEQHGWRPGLVFQNNKGNTYSPNTIVLPLTSAKKKLSQPTHVYVKAEDSGLKLDSMVLCENPERMSKDRLGQYITTLSDEYMKEVAVANLLASSAISFLDMDTLQSAWERASMLNKAAMPA